MSLGPSPVQTAATEAATEVVTSALPETDDVSSEQPNTSPSARPVRGWRVRTAWRLLALGRHCDQWPPALRRPLRPVIAVMIEGLVLGLLRPGDVETLVTATYAADRQYYDPRQYRQPYEARLLPALQQVATGTRLLDAFCGQGREARVFAEAGYQVTGVDRLDWMIDAARRYAHEASFPANFVVADFDALNVNPGFDVVYTSCWMYSTQQGCDRRARFLERCRSLCASGGVIVFSIVERPPAAWPASLLRYVLARLTACVTLGHWRTEFGERLYSGLFWHHLSVTQVERELQQANLRVLRTVSGTGVEPTFFFVTDVTHNDVADNDVADNGVAHNDVIHNGVEQDDVSPDRLSGPSSQKESR